MRFVEILDLWALSSLASPQLVFVHRAIDAVYDGCSNARIVQSTCERSADCPPMSYGNGRRAF